MTATLPAIDRAMMRLALRHARLGDPSPNPHVGAVIVANGRVVACGHHQRAGLAHAEVAAIEGAGSAARGSTLYVTFEPCNHFGRTGPCTEAILTAGIARVVIGCRDPAPHVPDAIERLRAAGVVVEVGILQPAAERLVADFVRHIRTGLPFVTLKAAITLDGRMATRHGESKWITGDKARREVHRQRAYADAVMVGVGTVLADDPELTVRDVPGRTPLRVVVDTHLRTPATARLLRAESTLPTLLFHAADAPTERRRRLTQLPQVECVQVPQQAPGVDLHAVLRELGRRSVVRLLVEGGPTLHGALLQHQLADRAAVFIAPKIFADPEARPLANAGALARLQDAWQLRDVRMRRLGDDTLFEGEVVKRQPLEHLPLELIERSRRSSG